MPQDEKAFLPVLVNWRMMRKKTVMVWLIPQRIQAITEELSKDRSSQLADGLLLSLRMIRFVIGFR